MTPSGHEVDGLGNILENAYTHLHEISEFASPYWRTSFTVDPSDWGFDNIWPAPPKAQDQVWFHDWERRV